MNAMPAGALVLLLGTASVFAADAPKNADTPTERLVPEVVDPLRPDDASAPIVSIRTLDNGDVVEEYRIGGLLNMVKVRPARGPAYTLHDTNGDGRLDRKDSEGPVAPVYWTLYEWN